MQAAAHAEAIRMQMSRAQRETGAPAGFAEQAYRAQQAYASEQAYQEYLAHAGQPAVAAVPHRAIHQVAASQTPRLAQQAASAFQQSTEANHTTQAYPAQPTTVGRAQYYTAAQVPARNQPAAAYDGTASTASQPNTYAPPVHIPPAPANHSTAQAVSPRDGLISLNDQRAPFPAATTNYPQRAVNPRPSAAPAQADMVPRGLQDKIANAISKTLPNPRSTVSAGRQVPARATAQSRSTQFAQTQQRRPTAAPTRQPASSLTPANRHSVMVGSNEVRQAVDQRVAARNRVQDIRQASMQEPLQNPFGDLPSSEAGTTTIPRWQNQTNRLPSSISQTPAKQISILNPAADEYPAPDAFEYVESPASQEGDAAEMPAMPSPPASGTSSDANPVVDQTIQDFANQLSVPVVETENRLRQQSNEPKSLMDFDNLEDELDEVEGQNLLDQSCEDFRTLLLDNPIRNIPLNFSPPASDLLGRRVALSRSWTNRRGTVLATGKMVDLRRGYVILDGGQKLSVARLSDADLAAISEYWDLPGFCTVGDRGTVDRFWAPQTVTWTASSLCHKPLYFENVQLERYGHTHGPIAQPIRSTVHFFVSLVSVPYQTAIHPPNECQYALGFYRPGDCAPWLKDPIPISLRGAGRQALVVTGLAFIP